MILRSRLNEYTEAEFLELINALCNDLGTEQQQNLWLEHFIEVTNHPDGSDLIYYPVYEEDGTPQRIIEIVKQWRSSQGLASFKDTQ
ncbi:colicin immunity protein E2 [Pragia fontium]|uniref:Colicin immunity protein E2 n=1 Tax=Pragia fontium TaxID=82985 RepID=A0ABQ5LJM6_9GAMM|nr:bacteriocin immunity protein [Pragia fontium]GKX63424.1 colicin immunity protein E2 [Pragia fontium]